jgi:EAL domain-containing protein (putative c-di-GMP-specific phosphodiesterase class I)
MSLRLLRDLRFEIAKIDGDLVRNVDTSPDGQAVVRAAIALAQEMEMYISAEAVETEGEANWLRSAGVGCLQGYLFGPPTVTPDFRAFRHGRPDMNAGAGAG